MIKQSLLNGDNRHLVDAIVPYRPCNQCMKSDVCMYKSDIEKNIKEIDDLFGQGTSDIIFGTQSSLSTINGISFVERFLTTFMPIIESEFKEELKNSSNRIDKYVSQVK